MATLIKSKALRTNLSFEEWKESIQPFVENVEEFSIVAKLSAGGVVVRTLRAPKSTKPFFGIVEDTIQIAEVRYTRNLTPYQPILSISYEQEDVGGTINVQLSPHPEMMDLGILYNIAGFLLIVSTVPILSVKPQLSVISCFFGVLLLVYPAIRARISFDEACSSAFKSIEKLPLGWIDH